MPSLLLLLFSPPTRESKTQISINYRVTSVFTAQVFRLPKVPPFYAALLRAAVCLLLLSTCSYFHHDACPLVRKSVMTDIQANEHGQMLDILILWIHESTENVCVRETQNTLFVLHRKQYQGNSCLPVTSYIFFSLKIIIFC